MTYTHEGEDILYVNKDRSKVVEEGSPEAAYVLVGPGGQIPDDEAERLGLTKAAKKDDAASKAQAPASNKAAAKAEDK